MEAADAPREIFLQALRVGFATAKRVTRNILPICIITTDPRSLPPVSERPDLANPDLDDVIRYVSTAKLAEYGVDGYLEKDPATGLSPWQSAHLRAWETLRTKRDGLDLLHNGGKPPLSTQSHGSHIFRVPAAQGVEWTLVNAAAGWGGDQDYLATWITAGVLPYLALQAGVITAPDIESDNFLLQHGTPVANL